MRYEMDTTPQTEVWDSIKQIKSHNSALTLKASRLRRWVTQQYLFKNISKSGGQNPEVICLNLLDTLMLEYDVYQVYNIIKLDQFNLIGLLKTFIMLFYISFYSDKLMHWVKNYKKKASLHLKLLCVTANNFWFPEIDIHVNDLRSMAIPYKLSVLVNSEQVHRQLCHTELSCLRKLFIGRRPLIWNICNFYDSLITWAVLLCPGILSCHYQCNLNQTKNECRHM